MPIKYTCTVTRPSGDVRFFQGNDNFWELPETVSYVTNTYESTGKLLSTACTDLDQLTTVWIEYWDTTESMNEFLADTFLDQRTVETNQHRQENNITVTHATEEVSIDSVPVGVFYRL